MSEASKRLNHLFPFALTCMSTYEKAEAAKCVLSGAKVCPICRRSTDLVSDHDHATGYTRERICRLCNAGLGMFRDDPRALRAAARYLLKHRAINDYETIRKHEKPSQRAAREKHAWA